VPRGEFSHKRAGFFEGAIEWRKKMIEILSYLILGLIAGMASGLMGIGGGLIVVPVLVFFFHMNQHTAQGTTLAMMVPPIGILAAWEYYKNGNCNLKAAGILCVAFVIGGLLGGRWANQIPAVTLQRTFGVIFFIASLKMIFGK
jgi:uncharacterized membrane protein YfcA